MRLSDRKLKKLERGINQGLKDTQIARRIGCHVNTVKKHRKKYLRPDGTYSANIAKREIRKAARQPTGSKIFKDPDSAHFIYEKIYFGESPKKIAARLDKKTRKDKKAGKDTIYNEFAEILHTRRLFKKTHDEASVLFWLVAATNAKKKIAAAKNAQGLEFLKITPWMFWRSTQIYASIVADPSIRIASFGFRTEPGPIRLKGRPETFTTRKSIMLVRAGLEKKHDSDSFFAGVYSQMTRRPVQPRHKPTADCACDACRLALEGNFFREALKPKHTQSQSSNGCSSGLCWYTAGFQNGRFHKDVGKNCKLNYGTERF